MTKLINYLYKYILQSIIGTIFRYGFQSNNEVITYSLVCKAWFEMVSEALSSNLNKYTCEDMKSFMELPIQHQQLKEEMLATSTSTSSIEMDQLPTQHTPQYNNQQSYKIIKLKDSAVVFNYYSEDDDYEIQDFSCDEVLLSKVISNSHYYKKVYINSASSRSSRELIKILDKVPDNVEADLYFPLFNQINNQNYINHHHKIDTINCSETNLNGLCALLECPPKGIIYSTVDLYQDINGYYFYLELQFEATSTHKINVDDLLFPSNQINLNQSSNLERFQIMTTVREMMKVVPIDKDASDQQRWDYIVNRLSNDPTLKELCYKNELVSLDKESLGELTEDQFYGGLKLILSNSKSLDTLSIRSNYELNDTVLQGLATSRSIKTLLLETYRFNLSTIVNKVLLVNGRTIRNLVINIYDRDIFSWLSLFKEERFKDQLDLYSISIHLRESVSLDKLLEYLKSSQFSVKEFKIVNNGKSVYSTSKTIQFYNNNTIINNIENI